MKKYLLLLCALVCGTLAFAQTAPGAVVHECVAEIGHWTTTGNNGTHVQNTWSTETDESGMRPPFCQNWVENGSTLYEATISHETLENLEAGFYTVSMDIRIFSQAGNAIGSGTTFNANGVSEDLHTGSEGHEGTYGSETEVYGTYHLLAQVTDAGTLDISLVIPDGVTYNWLAWKNLVVTYLGTTATLEVVNGDMNSAVQAAMEAAVKAWNESDFSNLSLYYEAEAAIEAAEASVAQYAEIAALVKNLDTTGAAVWAESTSGLAYAEKSLTTDDDFSVDMAAAQAAQTTPNSDVSYVLTSTGIWEAQAGLEYPIGDDPTITASYNGNGWSTGDVLWKTVTGLQAGTYKVEFYGAANYANQADMSGIYISNGASAFANDASVSIDINYRSSGNYSGALLEDEYRTVTCEVIDGSLKFGLAAETAGQTGNWYLAKAVSLTLVSLGVQLEEGEGIHTCEADINHWTTTGNNGSHVQNTWSGETDESGMTVPFCQNWVDKAYTLTPATISHNQLTGLMPGEYYTVSLDIRIFSEAGNAIGKGTLFTANGASEDLDTGSEGHEGTYGSETEVYGTYHLLAQATEDGTMDISLVIPEDATYNWLAWKNLSVTYYGEDGPVLEYVEGAMNADIEEAMKAAVDTYNKNKSNDYYGAALAAIEAAEESVAYYAPIVAAVGVLDEDGAAVWAESEYAEMLTERTLTNEDVSADLVAAQKAQTTEGTDWSYVLKYTGTWVNAIGANNFQNCPSLPTAHEIWSASAWDLSDGETSAAAIYKRIEDLPEGKYTISFYAYGNAAEDENRPLAYANDAETEVSYAAALEWNESSLYTLDCTVGVDNTLDFGMKTQGAGNWYVMEEYSLKLVEFIEPEDSESDYKPGDVITIDGYECTIVDENEIDNHSFELGFEGWTVASDFTTTISHESDFELRTDDPENGDYYLVGTSTSSNSSVAGSNGTSSLGTAWPIEPGKTYLFTYWLKQTDISQSAELNYLVTSLTNTPGTETKPLSDPESISEEWAPVQYLFTNGEEGADDCYGYVQVKFRWLKGRYGFDNFSLHEVNAVELDYANDVTWALANPSFEVDNVVANLDVDTTRGTENGGAWTVTSLTGWDLVVPNNNYSFHDIMTKDATATDNGFGAPGEPTDGTYMLYLRDGNNTTTSSVEQTITLPAGEYKLTVDSKCVSTDGSTAVLVAGGKSISLDIHSSYGSEEEALDWDTAELRFSLDATTDVTVGVDISYTGNGSFLLDNFKLYSVEEIEKEISWTMTDAGWGTMILPFAATLADGLTAYSCDGTEASTDEDGNVTTVVSLEEVGQSIEANTPYVIKCTDEDAIKAHSFSGTPTNEKEIYSEGIITGTLVDLAVAKGAALTTDGTNYVLQNHNEEGGEGLAFYPIIAATEDAENSADATLDAYHCYLDLSIVTTSARPVALHFPGAGETTAIVAVESDDLIANDAIYDLSGRRVAKAVKGVYIQNGKKVLVK